MNEIRRVYVAGPYSAGDTVANVAYAIDAANELRDAGYYPFVPHLSHFWNAQTFRPYEDWMEYDFEWVRQCQALVRLPGVSAGADREVALARELGIPVFFGVDEFLDREKEEAA